MAAAETHQLNGSQDSDNEDDLNDIEASEGGLDSCKDTCAECVDNCGECVATQGGKTAIYTVLGLVCVIGVLLTIILTSIPFDVKQVILISIFLTKLLNLYNFDCGDNTYFPSVYIFVYNLLVKSSYRTAYSSYSTVRIEIGIHLDVDIQYQMPQKQVYNAFKNFGEESNCAKYLALIMADSVRDTCGEYEAKDYYENRLSIQNTLETSLIANVRRAKAYFNITSAVLASYDFPDSLDDSINEKRAAENDIVIAENEREGSLVDAKTVLLTAKIEAAKVAIEAQAEEDSIFAEANAQSTAIHQMWINRGNVYDDIKTALNITVDRFVYQYLTSVTLLNAEDPIINL